MTLSELLDVVEKTEVVYLNTFDDDYGMINTILDCEPLGNLNSDSEYWSHKVLWMTYMVNLEGRPVLRIEITA